MRNRLICLLIIVTIAANALAQPIELNFPKNASFKRLAYEFIAHSPKDDSKTVTLRLMFDDGNILEVSGTAADAKAYNLGKLSDYDYSNRLDYNPLTRGPVLVPGLCEPSKGENCGKNPECACQNIQTCSPGSVNADKKGCADKKTPKNAYKLGSEYVCNEGLVWNADLTGCTEPLKCQTGEIGLEGKCYVKQGSSGSDLCCFLTGSGILAMPVITAAATLLLVLTVYVYKKRQKQKSAQDTKVKT